MLSFKSAFSASSFTFIRRLSSFCGEPSPTQPWPLSQPPVPPQLCERSSWPLPLCLGGNHLGSEAPRASPPAHSTTSEALEAHALHPTCSSYAPHPGPGRAGPLGLVVACPLAWGLERSPRPPAQGMVPARACPAHPEHLRSRASLSPVVSLVVTQPVFQPLGYGHILQPAHPQCRGKLHGLQNRSVSHGREAALANPRTEASRTFPPVWTVQRVTSAGLWDLGVYCLPGSRTIATKAPGERPASCIGDTAKEPNALRARGEIWAAVHRVMPGWREQIPASVSPCYSGAAARTPRDLPPHYSVAARTPGACLQQPCESLHDHPVRTLALPWCDLRPGMFYPWRHGGRRRS